MALLYFKGEETRVAKDGEALAITTQVILLTTDVILGMKNSEK